MKFFFTCLAALVCAQIVIAQNIGIGTPTPHTSAMLDVTSTNKGILIPRVTEANRPASPATGLLIYQTNNTPGFYYYNGSTWVMLGGGSGFALPYTGSTAGNTFNITSTDGIGITGASSAATGNWYGGQFTSASTAGSGVYGAATAATGTTFGGQFATLSTSGRGVYGGATAATGATYGGYFLSQSTGGRGVYGLANAATGLTRGGQFESNSITGTGVYGIALSTSGDARGGEFVSNSSSGTGVKGYASSTTGTTYGVYGQISSSSGSGVYGDAQAATGVTYGVIGVSNSVQGVGIYGHGQSVTGNNIGVYGTTNSSEGVGGYFMAWGSNEYLALRTGQGQVQFDALAGTGTRMVVANDAGRLSTQAIAGGQWVASGNNISNSNTGNVGVGTATPNYKLHLTGGDLFIQSSSGLFRLGFSGANEWQMATTNAGADLRWYTTTNGGTTVTPRHYFSQNGNVGLGDFSLITPEAPLHVYKNTDVWHSFIGGETGRLQIGGQTLNGAVLQSWNPTTNQARDIYLQRDGGNVGIGTNNATSKLDMVDNNPVSVLPSVKLAVNNSDNAIRIFKNGAAGNGIYVNNNVVAGNKSGIVSIAESNTGGSIGVLAVAGNDGSGTHPQANDQVGVEGMNLNSASGFGVIGRTRAPSGAGVVASYTGAGTGNALLIENGFIKVAGTNRSAFQVVSSAANTSSNSTSLSYPNASNTDIVTVTPVWTGAYLNSPIGIFFTSGEWRVFRQDLVAMPNGITFNVIVIKQ